jgi:secondary thiamine-phosphate synthase enzyme
MSRSSTVTSRATPLAEGASAAAGTMVVRGESVVVQTDERIELLDLTDRLMTLVRESGVREGVVNVWAMHTTCALFISEFQSALLADIRGLLEKIVGRDEEWLHNDPAHSDCDRMNADAHLRSLLLGHSLALQVTGGEVVMGQWQRVLMAELDGPRARSLRVQVLGVA